MWTCVCSSVLAHCNEFLHWLPMCCQHLFTHWPNSIKKAKETRRVEDWQVNVNLCLLLCIVLWQNCTSPPDLWDRSQLIWDESKTIVFLSQTYADWGVKYNFPVSTPNHPLTRLNKKRRSRVEGPAPTGECVCLSVPCIALLSHFCSDDGQYILPLCTWLCAFCATSAVRVLESSMSVLAMTTSLSWVFSSKLCSCSKAPHD